MTTTRIRETERNESLELEDVYDNLNEKVENLKKHLSDKIDYDGSKNLSDMCEFVGEKDIAIVKEGMIPTVLNNHPNSVSEDDRRYLNTVGHFIYKGYIYEMVEHSRRDYTKDRYDIFKWKINFSEVPRPLGKAIKDELLSQKFTDLLVGKYESISSIKMYGDNMYFSAVDSINGRRTKVIKFNLYTLTKTTLPYKRFDFENVYNLHKAVCVKDDDRKGVIDLRTETIISPDTYIRFVDGGATLSSYLSAKKINIIENSLVLKPTSWGGSCEFYNIDTKTASRATERGRLVFQYTYKEDNIKIYNSDGYDIANLSTQKFSSGGIPDADSFVIGDVYYELEKDKKEKYYTLFISSGTVKETRVLIGQRYGTSGNYKRGAIWKIISNQDSGICFVAENSFFYTRGEEI